MSNIIINTIKICNSNKPKRYISGSINYHAYYNEQIDTLRSHLIFFNRYGYRTRTSSIIKTYRINNKTIYETRNTFYYTNKLPGAFVRCDCMP